MINILRYMKRYWFQCLLVFGLLFVQAYCDLSLPAYTSDIVDTGIQNSGIESSTPEALSQSSLDQISVFLNQSEIKYIKKYYKQVDSIKETNLPLKNSDYSGKVYVLNTEDESTLKMLNKIFSSSFIMTTGLSNLDRDSFQKMMTQTEEEQSGTTENASATIDKEEQQLQLMATMDKSQVEAMQKAQEMMTGDAKDFSALEFLSLQKQAGLIQEGDLVKMRNDSFNSYGEDIASSMGIASVKAEYEAMNIDAEKIQTNYLFKTGSIMIGFAILMTVASIIASLFASKVGAGLGRDLREGCFKKVVSFSNSEMDRFSTASLITRSTNDVVQVQMVVIMFLRMVAYAPIVGIGGIVKVLNTNSSMTWIIGLAILAVACLVLVLITVAMPKFKIMQKLVDKLNLVSREILTGIPVIRAFSREKYEEKRFDKANVDLTRTQLFTNRAMSFMFPLMMLIMNLTTALIIWVSAKNIDAGTLQVGQMTAFISYTMQIVMSFLMLTMISIMLPRAIVSANRIGEVLDTESSIEDKEHTVGKKVEIGKVAFNNVSFTYPGADEEVLSNINFEANPGETVAFIGSTGSGKSTLINLIPRFYDVTKGSITIDGVDLRDMKLTDIRDAIGYVPQKGVLFTGTIASNLRFGNDNASDEEIAKAAEIAQATEFIDEKEEKYDTEISQGGTNVSGGQKQRLSIARAIAKHPKIFIFDDSFSALDFKTDSVLRKALRDNVKDATLFIVAQRISTILHADKIVVLDEGNVVGIGTHSHLLRTCEVYQQIAISQLSRKELENSLEDEEEGGVL